MSNSEESDGTIVVAEAAASGDTARLDFGRPDRIPAPLMEDLRGMHERFARNLDTGLALLLHAPSSVKLSGLEQLAFSEFSRGLPSPDILLTLALKPLDGRAVMRIDSTIVYPVLEMTLGGTAEAQAAPDRQITEIERTLLRGFFQLILDELSACWRHFAEAEFSILAFGAESGAAAIIAPHDTVLVAEIEMQIGAGSGRMSVAVPAAAVGAMCQKAGQAAAKKTISGPGRQRQILRLIGPAKLELEARLTGAGLTVGDLMNLRTGDLLAFDHPIERPLEVLVAGIPQFAGTVTALGNRRALAIERAGTRRAARQRPGAVSERPGA